MISSLRSYRGFLLYYIYRGDFRAGLGEVHHERGSGLCAGKAGAEK